MHFYTNLSGCPPPPFNLFCTYDLVSINVSVYQFSKYWADTGHKTCASFRASFTDQVLTSYCSNVACQHMNVETCSKTCASFLLVCHHHNESC